MHFILTSHTIRAQKQKRQRFDSYLTSPNLVLFALKNKNKTNYINYNKITLHFYDKKTT